MTHRERQVALGLGLMIGSQAVLIGALVTGAKNPAWGLLMVTMIIGGFLRTITAH